MENLPRYFALESLSNSKYLRYIHEEDVALYGHLEFSGEEVISLYTKFEMEPAKNESHTGLFNIRCCYNNRYWTRREKNTRWITATATEPVEDQFKWSCTLFQPSIQVSEDGKSTLLRLRHVQHDRSVPVSIGSGDPTYRSCLKADANPPVLSGEDSSNTAFCIVDWESFVILPKLVAFKGNDGLYLRCLGNNFKFDSSDVSLVGISNQVHYSRDGSVRLTVKYKGNNGLVNFQWYDDSSGRVIAYGISSMYTWEDLFWIAKGHGDNEVAIRSKVATTFCERSDSDSYQLKVGASSTMVKEAIMRAEEPIVSRSVYNVNFCLERARIYDQCDVIMVSKQFSNPLDVDEVTHLARTFTKETTRTWNSSVTLKLATPTKMKTKIPLIVDGEVGFSDEFEGRYEWGTDMKGSQTIELSDHIDIPARSTVMVHVIATKAKCDVPFSYMQRDTLPDATVVISKMDDGVYAGINYYNFKTEVVKIS